MMSNCLAFHYRFPLILSRTERSATAGTSDNHLDI